MLGVLIHLVTVGGVFHKHTSGPQIRAVRSDLALAGHLRAPTGWSGWELARAVFDGQPSSTCRACQLWSPLPSYSLSQPCLYQPRPGGGF